MPGIPLGALDNLKAKLKAVFKDKKQQEKPAATTESKPAENPTPATVAEDPDATKTAPAEPTPAMIAEPAATTDVKTPPVESAAPGISAPAEPPAEGADAPKTETAPAPEPAPVPSATEAPKEEVKKDDAPAPAAPVPAVAPAPTA